MDQTGTLLAVVGPANSTAASRDGAVKTVLARHKVSQNQLKGKRRQDELQTFPGGSGWHRGADVDRLSETEAGIIGARIVRRTETKAFLTREKADILRSIITEATKRRFLQPDDTPQLRLSNAVEEVLNAARAILDERELAAFREAIELGYRPLENER
jgi:hypothetical protein